MGIPELEILLLLVIAISHQGRWPKGANFTGHRMQPLWVNQVCTIISSLEWTQGVSTEPKTGKVGSAHGRFPKSD